MRIRTTFSFAALVAGAACSMTGCGRQTGVAHAQDRKVIVLGIDGMDPAFVESHWGDLPNLKKLSEQGGFERLATTIPPQSPVAWSTFITGLDPGGHGIYDFIHRNAETAMPFSSMSQVSEPGHTLSLGRWILPLTSAKVQSLRKGKPFWQTLSERGVPVTILRMPTNFPPVEAGQAVSGMGTPDMRGTFGTFTFFTSKPSSADADSDTAGPRQVPGGIIVPVRVENGRATLEVEGPQNSLLRDQPRISVPVTVDIDPDQPVARFQTGGSQFILKQGEWSQWVPAAFPLIPRLKSVSGMFRIYAKQIHPFLQIYVSPINIDPARPAMPVSAPEKYSAELAGAVGPFYTQGMAEDTAALRQGVFTLDEYIAQTRLVATEHLRLFRKALEDFRTGLLFFHFFGVDQNSHMMWGRHERPLLDTYRMVDETVGHVMRTAPDATIIVMSDHGFSTFDRAVHLNAVLREQGFLSLDDPANAGADELFAHVDWSRTQAYALGLNALYVNLAGRERNGTVEPAARDALLKQIAEKLLAFRDPANGRKVVETVYFPREQFHGSTGDAGPDLLVGYAAGYRASWQTALGAVPAVTVDDNREAWIGDHCIAAHLVPGVLIANRNSKIADPRLEDLPASLLSAFGVPPAEGAAGRVLY